MPERPAGWVMNISIILLLGGFCIRTGAQIADHRLAAEREWTVSTASAMERVGRSEQRPGKTAVTVRGARNEYVSFQIVISAGGKVLRGVKVSASDLTGPGGIQIPHESLSFYREYYVHVVKPSPDRGWGNRPLGEGWYPDALIPLVAKPSAQNRNAGFDVGAGMNQPVWADVLVPAGAAAGTYRGVVGITSGGQTKDVQMTLRVWNFELPLRPTLRSSFGMHEPALTDRSIHELLLQHRVMPASVNPEDAQELSTRYGLNATGLRFWSNFSKTTCTMNPPPSATSILAKMAQYPPGVQIHLYAADEIDPCPQVFKTVRQWGAAAHGADSRLQTLVTVAPTHELFSDGTATQRSAVDIWALLPKYWDLDADGIREARARGGEIWAYTALVQEAYSPKWEIDFAPINFRIFPGFLAQSLGVTGILYWRVELWNASPFDDLGGYTIGSYSYPGEGMLLYPGAPVGVKSALPSMRLKWIRAGVQDFEYTAILKRKGREEWALKHARRAGTDWHNWETDPEVLETMRAQMGDEIERLAAPASPAASGALN